MTEIAVTGTPRHQQQGSGSGSGEIRWLPDDPVARAFRGRRVLVTGAGGTIGREACRQLLSLRPDCIVLLDHSEYALFSAVGELAPGDAAPGGTVVPVLGSICDGDMVDRLMRRHRIDSILHAAAYKHVPIVEANPSIGLRNNFLGTATLARRAAEAGVGRFVLVSSDKAVRPAGVMGLSKRLAELALLDVGRRFPSMTAAVVRFGNVMGSSGSVVETMRRQIALGGPVTVTHPAATRYFMSLGEAVGLLLAGGSLAQAGDVLMLDMGAPVRIADLARRLVREAGLDVRDAANPQGQIEIVMTGLRPGEKLMEELPALEAVPLPGNPRILRLPATATDPRLLAQLRAEVEHLVAAGDDTRLRSLAKSVAPLLDGVPLADRPRRSVSA